MGVNFSPFEIGRRALAANQFGLNVTGHNIANVNTPGFARQSVRLSAVPPNEPLGLQIGGGVAIEGVRSFRDRFIESRLQTETAIAGRLAARRDALAPVEAALGTDGGGIQPALEKFFGAFRDLEAHPNSLPLRAVATERGETLGAAFRSTRQRLEETNRAADGDLRATVNEVNELSRQVAAFNARISEAEHAGADASELHDARGVAVTRLVELSGARAVENVDGSLTLTLNDGRALVLGDKAEALVAVDTPPTGLATITLAGQPAALVEGSLRGLLDAISQTGAQIDSLDALALSIAERVNALHTSGTDLDGNAGVNFFDTTPAGQPINAKNFSVNPVVKNDPRLVVASPQPAGSPTATIAGAIAGLLTDPDSQVGARTGSFTSIFSSILAETGEQIRSTQDSLATQNAILSQITAQRDAVSGVSLDEEAINLLQYQRAYEAAARFLRVADELTQTILALGQ